MSTPTPRSGYGPPMMMAAAAHAGPMLSPNDPSREYQQSVMEVSEDSINSIEKVEEWSSLANGHNSSGRSPHRSPQRMVPNGGTPSPRENGKKCTKRAMALQVPTWRNMHCIGMKYYTCMLRSMSVMDRLRL